MANFQVHVTVAATASFIAGLSAYTLLFSDIPQTLFLIMLGLVGGILPDIDSPHSTAVAWVFNMLGLVIAVTLLFFFVGQLGVLCACLMAAASFFSIRYTIKPLLSQCCVHRGIIHSIPVGLIFAGIIVLVVNMAMHNQLFAWLCGLFLLFGFFIHLLLDEIYSVDLGGVRLKKSFGTALSIYSNTNKVGYLIAYLILIGLFFLLPKNNVIPLIQSKLILKSMIKNLLPPGWGQ